LRLGILSDIHGNLEALERALDFLAVEGVVRYICLGDIVGYGASPEECVTRLRKLDCLTVAGNHDRAVLDQVPLRNLNPAARKALKWTSGQLSPASRRYLESLNLVERCAPFRLVHAAPSAPGDWDYVQTVSDITFEFTAFSESACLIGHSHAPFAVKQHAWKPTPQRIHEPEFELGTNHAARFLINAGSIGQPRDHDPRLCVLTYDTDTRRLRFHRLDYDVARAQAKILAAGLPEALALRLSVGR
jgi:predicted phosphodiesterase